MKVAQKKLDFQVILIFLFFIIVSFIFIFPFIWMISSSFKSTGDIFSAGIQIIPENPTLNSYKTLFYDYPFLNWLKNSLLFTIGFIIFGLLFSSMAGYALAKYDFKFSRIIFIVIVAGLMFPMHVQLVPLFIMLTNIGWLNTYVGLIVPVLPHPFGVFFVRQYMMSLDDDLLDAARVDGASEFGIFFRIILPLSKPVLAAVAIYFGVFSWNQLLWPLIVMRSSSMFTLTVGITSLIGQYRPSYDLVMAASFLSTFPLVVLFMRMQQQFIAGLTAGSVKG
ncbi:MAG: carbohydrate ABC transporter permease [Candidatus Woesearchaeota archaeon]